MLFYSSIWLLSSLLPLQPPPASTAAPAGGSSAGGLHLSGEHWDRQPQVSKSMFGKYTQMLYKLFRPTPESALFTPWRVGICKKRGNISYAKVSSWRTRTWADFADEMSVSAGGSGSVGWRGVDKTQPLVHTSALPPLSFAPGAARRRATALPAHSVCSADCWVTNCAAALTPFHFCMT